MRAVTRLILSAVILILTGLLAAVAISLISPAPSDEVQGLFNRALAMEKE